MLTSKPLAKQAKQKTKYKFVYFKKGNKKHGSKDCWIVIVYKSGKRYNKTGFNSDIEAHNYIINNLLDIVAGRPLLRKAG